MYFHEESWGSLQSRTSGKGPLVEREERTRMAGGGPPPAMRVLSSLSTRGPLRFSLHLDAMKHSMDIISNIGALFNAIEDHTLGNRNHLRQCLMEHTDQWALVAVVRAPICNKSKEFICQLFLIVQRKERTGHRNHPFATKKQLALLRYLF